MLVCTTQSRYLSGSKHIYPYEDDVPHFLGTQVLSTSFYGEFPLRGLTHSRQPSRGISYILFFAIFGNILRWSYGYNLLKNPTKIDSDDKASFANPNTHNASVEQGWTRDTELKHYAATSNPSNAYTSQSSLLSPRPANERSTLLSPRPADERSTLLAFPRFPHDNDDTPPHSLRSHPYVARLSYLAHHLRTQIPPPLYAAFLALIVGLTPPLKRLFFDPSSFLQPSFTTAIISCGATAVPLIMICLGAQMNELLSASRSSQPATVRPVALVIVARMLITPLYIIPVVALFAVVTGGEGHMSAVVADPVFLLVLILLGCAPTAVNLVQICQVHDVFEEEMTRVLFWSYGIVAVPVTIVVMVALVIVQLVT
ncbi:auxin efflux carrier [Jimgerdemannia flammicorona]|uniref:Auxin efflux carrier n=1 Tax=Jimgerdemannia flammicorona TaxID=994334 RepID=A0A433QDI7_9FUNG|nr:auxin efflux carrier [Jimgerdemannia flammicorona]